MEGKAATYLVHVVDEPIQIIALEIPFTSRIFPSVEYVVKLIAKIGLRRVEATEFLQGRVTWRGHEGPRWRGKRGAMGCGGRKGEFCIKNLA